MSEDDNKPLEPEYDEEIDCIYANNIQFESSIWDLKFRLGQLNQEGGKFRIEKRAEVTIPWLQAKIAAFFLQLNVALHEEDNGPIKIPAPVMPLAPDTMAAVPDVAGNEAFNMVYRKVYEQFFPQQ